ncbi:MAG: hypothetical protein KF836_06815 [Fimbriimonadaceae bacterium]|nr:hypothetical protein [Fimbriimonadaceae bacterium]
MRIVNHDKTEQYDKITLFLNKTEIEEMIGFLTQLRDSTAAGDHFHCSDSDFQREVTLAHFKPGETQMFDRFSRGVIEGP